MFASFLPGHLGVKRCVRHPYRVIGSSSQLKRGSLSIANVLERVGDRASLRPDLPKNFEPAREQELYR